MLDRRTVDHLRQLDTGGHPVVSVYVGVSSNPTELWALPTRLKALVHSASEAESAKSLNHELRQDMETVVGMADLLKVDQGRGAALFVCGATGLAEHLSLPIPVRDLALVDAVPYLSPLEALLEQFQRYCAVLIGRRTASIYRFYMGVLESWEQLAEEDVRKGNYGGFSGYEEQHARGHAEAVALRLFRATAGRVGQLLRAGEFDSLAVGGNPTNIDPFVAELPADVRSRLVGTFVADPHTASMTEISDQCRVLAIQQARVTDEKMVDELMEAAGARNRGVLGLDRTIDAANQRAIDKLLVGARQTVPGVVCTSCGWLARSGEACAACGGETRPVVDLFDALAEATRAEGGSVRYLLPSSPLGDAEIGALVRFPVPMQPAAEAAPSG